MYLALTATGPNEIRGKRFWWAKLADPSDRLSPLPLPDKCLCQAAAVATLAAGTSLCEGRAWIESGICSSSRIPHIRVRTFFSSQRLQQVSPRTCPFLQRCNLGQSAGGGGRFIGPSHPEFLSGISSLLDHFGG